MPLPFQFTDPEAVQTAAQYAVVYADTDGRLFAKMPSGNSVPLGGDAASSITGLIEPGTNVTITGTGTGLDPYVINSTGGGGGGSGTVTSVSVVTANGVSGTVATATTTPAITLSLGAITPTSVVASGTVSGSNLSGTNTGDQTNITGNAATVTTINGRIAAGSNVTLSGVGTAASPYVINSTGGGGGGSGTVTSVSVVTANGISGTVADPTTTPAISLALGAITPSSVNGVALSGTATPTLAVSGTSSISGVNTGDQTSVTGNAGTATALQTAWTINGVAFNGTANIVVPAAGSTLTDTVPVTLGGTGVTTASVAYGLIAAGTTATGPLQTLAAGGTTQVLLGGGASALPVWTNTTGTGAPVRSVSPTLVTPALGTPTSLVLTNATGLPLSGLAQSGATTGQVPGWDGSAWVPTTPGAGSGGDMLSTLTAAEISVTTTATLTISRMHVCSGTSADYTVTLPPVSGNAGKFVGVRISPACTKLITVDGNASETIDGITSRVMIAKEVAILFCDGTTWTKVAGKSQSISIVAVDGGTSQSVASNTITELDLATASTDLYGSVNLATNTITIPRTGVWSIRFIACYYDFAADSSEIDAAVRYNGTNDWRRDRRYVAYLGAATATQSYPTLVVPSVAMNVSDTLVPTLYIGGTTAKTLAGLGVHSLIEINELPSW